MLIPDDLVPKLEALGINLGQIANKAIAEDFIPGTLFELNESVKKLRLS